MLKKSHNCKEVADRLMLLLDGELNAKEEQDVICEVHRCMHCLEKYNLEKRFKEYLQTKLERKCCPGSLISNMLLKLKDEK